MIYVNAFVNGAFVRRCYEVKTIRKRSRVYHRLTRLS